MSLVARPHELTSINHLVGNWWPIIGGQLLCNWWQLVSNWWAIDGQLWAIGEQLVGNCGQNQYFSLILSCYSCCKHPIFCKKFVFWAVIIWLYLHQSLGRKNQVLGFRRLSVAFYSVGFELGTSLETIFF